jgi:hypothetical protein
MIINFKISFKSMNNLLMSKELGELNKSKYMHLRVYLNSLYQVLEK